MHNAAVPNLAVVQKRSILASLERACNLADWIVYRPAIISATKRFPRWWRCDLARLSVWLDERWQTGYWADRGPGPMCTICQRRAAWLQVGGSWAEIGPDDGGHFMEKHELHLCFWCSRSLPIGEITNQRELDDWIGAARRRSISWSWRWPKHA